MAFPPTFALPNSQGYPSPVVLEKAFREWKPNPADFQFAEHFPDIRYATPSVTYDVLGSPTGRLVDSDQDAQPKAVASRKAKTVSLMPVYRDRLEVMRPSDAVNQRAFGRLDAIDPMEKAAWMMEDVAIAIQVEKELMRVQALNGTLQPVIAGANGATYTYPVQTFTTSVTWANIAGSNPIADIMTMVNLLAGNAEDPVLWIPLSVAQYLCQNAAVVNLAKQSAFVQFVGPGSTGETVSGKQICSLLQVFTGVKEVRIYDKGYKTMDGAGAYTYNRFMGATKVLLIGKPPEGQPLGGFALTPTINQGGFSNPQPGEFLKVYDYTVDRPNGTYEVYGGFSGIIELHFPECVVCGTVIV